MSNCKLRWSELGLVDYEECFKLMQQFTHHRDNDSEDLILSLEHNPVITVGPTTEPLNELDIKIPIIKTNRGGKATYHGPGQWIIYTLIDLRRLGITASQLVSILEDTVIASLRVFGIHAYANPNARGVYIKQQKIASIGIRISKGCSYHGLSFNLDMDLSPFNAFSVCGNEHLTMTQFSKFKL